MVLGVTEIDGVLVIDTEGVFDTDIDGVLDTDIVGVMLGEGVTEIDGQFAT